MYMYVDEYKVNYSVHVCILLGLPLHQSISLASECFLFLSLVQWVAFATPL